MSRPLMVIAAFLFWALGSTYWYTCELKRVCEASTQASVSSQTASAAAHSADLPNSNAPKVTAAATTVAAAIPRTSTENTASAREAVGGNAKVAVRSDTVAAAVRVLFPMRKAKRHPHENTTRDLERIAAQLQERGRVTVTGFTDERGGEDMNMRLAQRRAEAVRDELIAMGVNAGLIDVMAAGPQTPFATNDTVMGRQLNRRVEITLHLQ
jgi:OmpA-OmpF porin, OOP family